MCDMQVELGHVEFKISFVRLSVDMFSLFNSISLGFILGLTCLD